MSGRPGRNGTPHGLAGPKAERTVSLALQGGGAHGAFTWGVLDALIEDGRLAFEAITGASAGAMNAVVMADGWLEGGPDGARSQLEAFWKRVSFGGDLSDTQRAIVDRILGWYGDDSPARLWLGALAGMTSPYDVNPLDINPLRGVIEEMVDFARLRRARQIEIFVSATNVWTGKGEVFRRKDLAAEHLLASACLPTLFRAVEIDGVPYWDGGYMGNPALYPLFYEAKSDDVLLVQINPVERRTTPRTALEIQDRLTEITFNGGLLRELRAVDFVARLIDEGKLSRDDYKRVLMHRIGGGDDLDAFAASSRLHADWSLFVQLRDLGRANAHAWLKRHYEAIGVRATLDMRKAYS